MPEEFRDAIDPNNGDGFDLGRVGTEAIAPEPAGDLRKLRKRKDGQPWGSGGKSAGAAKTEKVRSTLDLSSITGIFVGFHVLLAERTGIPEFAMDMSEGQQLQKAVENVMRHYPVDTSQKAVDWAALIGAGCMIYGTRWGSYMMRKHHERQPSTHNYTMAAAPAPNAPRNGSGRAPEPSQPAQQFSEAALVETDFEGE